MEETILTANALKFRYDPEQPVYALNGVSVGVRRGEFVANMVKESGAQGLVLFMQQFCDPEEMEFPYLKKALDAAGIPFIKLGIDQQMRDFGQAATAIQAFADVLSVKSLFPPAVQGRREKPLKTRKKCIRACKLSNRFAIIQIER